MNKIAKELLMLAKEMNNIYGEPIDIGEEYEKKSGGRISRFYPKISSYELSLSKEEITFDTLKKIVKSLIKEAEYELQDCGCERFDLIPFVSPRSNNYINIIIKAYLNIKITEDVLLQNGYKRIK